MQSFKIEETKYTPYVLIDPENNNFNMTGQSYPENAAKFYKIILQKFDEFIQNSDQNAPIIVNFKLIYLNTSSSKAILILLDILNDTYNNGRKAEINWYYHKENELAYEVGLELKDYIDVPFNFILVEE